MRFAPTTAVILLFAAMLAGTPPSAAQACQSFDGFEDYAPFTPPTTSCWYGFGGSGNSVVVPTMAYEGEQSLFVPAGSNPDFNWAQASTCESVTEFFMRLDALPGDWKAGYNTDEFGQAGGLGPSAFVAVGGAGAVALLLDPTAAGPSQPIYSTTVPGIVVAPDQWYEVSLHVDCSGTNLLSVVITDTVTSQVYGTAITSGVAISAGGELGIFEVDNSANAVDSWVDNLNVESALLDQASVPRDQVAVTALTGYSMDAGGRNIVVRTSGGDVVETYAVDGLDQVATTTTPDCVTRSDGVNAALYFDQVWVTYVDCDGDGESDAFRIRDYALSVPTFPCDEATENVDNNAEVDVPNNLGDIGTISDVDPSYIKRCGDAGFDDASVGWSFSTVGGAGVGGKVGAFGVVYNSGILTDETDEETATLDTSATPSINQFCSWQDDEGHDYFGATADSGPTGIFEVTTTVNQKETQLGKEIDLDLHQRFINDGTYGSAAGIACADGVVVIQKMTTVHVLLNVTTAPVVAPGWPKTIANTHERGVAITGSGRFIAVNHGDRIHVYALNGTETTNVAEPTGTWRGMEFDHSGEHLAMFTSTLITVDATEDATCGLEGNCAALGNVQEEGGPSCPNPPCAVTATSSPPSGGGGAAGDFGAFGNFAGAAIVTFGAIIVAYAVTRRKEEGGPPGGET